MDTIIVLSAMDVLIGYDLNMTFWSKNILS